MRSYIYRTQYTAKSLTSERVFILSSFLCKKKIYNFFTQKKRKSRLHDVFFTEYIWIDDLAINNHDTNDVTICSTPTAHYSDSSFEQMLTLLNNNYCSNFSL